MHNAPGIMILRLSGNDLSSWYNEAGGHRIQRVPPTERKGRTHTSTVTVAVLEHMPAGNTDIKESDLKIEWYSGTGPGGQNKNKVQCSIRLTHIPTGITKTAQTRSRKNSYNIAYDELIDAVIDFNKKQQHRLISNIRKNQVGSGMRGDKIRTIRFQDDQAIDHRNNKKITAKEYMAGKMNKLWD